MHGKVTYISFNTAHGSDRVIRQCMELGSREVVVFEALVDVEAESVVFELAVIVISDECSSSSSHVGDVLEPSGML
jgi:hypothetical protein